MYSCRDSEKNIAEMSSPFPVSKNYIEGDFTFYPFINKMIVYIFSISYLFVQINIMAKKTKTKSSLKREISLACSKLTRATRKKYLQ